MSTLTANPTAPSFNGVTQQIMVALDMPVSLQLTLAATAGTFSGGVTVPTANADFGHSFDFPVGSDLFNLPAGVTVNEPDRFIVDNRFVPVPEPGGLLAVALAAVSFLTTRRSRL
jgi:hypothetical protein